MGKIIIEASSMSELAALFAQLSASAAPNMTVSVQPMPSAGFAGDHIGPTETDDDEGPTNTAAPETDKNGLRWDARIHASSKALNTDGTWRMQRGIEKKLGADKIAAIEAELRSGAPAPGQPPAMPAPIPMQTPVSEVTMQPPSMPAPGMPPQVPQNAVFPQPNIPAEVLQPPAPVAPPVTPPAPAPAPLAGVMQFNEFMPLLGRMMQPHPANQHVYVDAGYLSSLCQYLGVENITQIAADTGKIAAAVDKLKADQRWWVA